MRIEAPPDATKVAVGGGLFHPARCAAHAACSDRANTLREPRCPVPHRTTRSLAKD